MKYMEEVERRQEEREDNLIQTRRGVYKDLKHSPHFIIVGEYKLPFSSNAKKQKFIKDMKIKEVQFETALIKAYGYDFDREQTNFNALINSMVLTHYRRLKNK